MKTYSTVEELMEGECFPEAIRRRVKELLNRDKFVVIEFAEGSSTKKLARKYSLPVSVIEDILRFQIIVEDKKKMKR